MTIPAAPEGGSPGRRVMARCDALAAFTDEPGRLTRLYLSPSHRAAADQVAAWMREAGMAVRIDALGTVIGRYEGARPGARALLVGSHIDSVRDAGKYDGPLGVLTGIAAVESLRARGAVLPFAVEVVAFGDEEGVRFPTTMLTSRALAGWADPAMLQAVDADGVTVAEALRAFGGDPDGLASCAKRREDVLGYVEVHIEQGPVLEAVGAPLGVVTGISGAGRYTIVLTGTAGHAGTTPMDRRADALAGAAEMIVAIERYASETPDIVATVGTLTVAPGAPNVIAGSASFSLDIRSPDDATRAAGEAAVEAMLGAIATRRGLGFTMKRYLEARAVRCDPVLVERLSHAIGNAAPLLPSGAGHDGMAIAELCPIGMIFVRCRGGISHNPAESILAEDADRAVRALVEFILALDRDGPAAIGRPE